jgi:hypothetical protein
MDFSRLTTWQARGLAVYFDKPEILPIEIMILLARSNVPPQPADGFGT